MCIHDEIRHKMMTGYYKTLLDKVEPRTAIKILPIWNGVLRKYSGQKWGLRWTLKGLEEHLYNLKERSTFSRRMTWAQFLGVIKCNPLTKIPSQWEALMRFFASQQMSHLFNTTQYPVVQNSLMTWQFTQFLAGII